MCLRVLELNLARDINQESREIVLYVAVVSFKQPEKEFVL